MKKILLSTLVLGMALFMSCSKNSDSAANSGDNGGGGSIINPGKRIYENYEGYDSYVYISHDDGETWEETSHYVKALELHKVYHWEGKKLMSFDYYRNDGQGSSSTVFEYNDAGLVTRKIWAWDESEVENFYYNDNSQMIKFDHYKYFNGNVSHYRAQDVFWSNNKIDRIREADNNNANYTKYYWTNENLTKYEGYDHNSNYLGSYTEIRYDNKNNPHYCGMSMTPYAYYGSLGYISKNNVLSQRIYNSDGDLTRTVTYTYEYNEENFPIERYKTEEEIYEDNEGNLRKSVTIYHNTYTYLND